MTETFLDEGESYIWMTGNVFAILCLRRIFEFNFRTVVHLDFLVESFLAYTSGKTAILKRYTFLPQESKIYD